MKRTFLTPKKAPIINLTGSDTEARDWGQDDQINGGAPMAGNPIKWLNHASFEIQTYFDQIQEQNETRRTTTVIVSYFEDRPPRSNATCPVVAIAESEDLA